MGAHQPDMTRRDILVDSKWFTEATAQDKKNVHHLNGCHTLAAGTMRLEKLSDGVYRLRHA